MHRFRTGELKYQCKVCVRLHLFMCACADWLVTGALQKMVLVVTSVFTKEVLERWTFDIQTDKAVLSGE